MKNNKLLKDTILELKLAELQFRLASTVRLAVNLEEQYLDVPTQWSHGKHTVSYEEIVLRQDQAEIASQYLERTSTYLLALTIKEALLSVYGKEPWESKDSNVVSAYIISRLIRDAFAHGPIRPAWEIAQKYENTIFEIVDVIRLDTTGLDGKEFNWRDYGGLLALFKLSKFIRIELLKDTDKGVTRKLPKQKMNIIKQGNLILKEVDKIPSGIKKVTGKNIAIPDGEGGYHYLTSKK